MWKARLKPVNATTKVIKTQQEIFENTTVNVCRHLAEVKSHSIKELLSIGSGLNIAVKSLWKNIFELDICNPHIIDVCNPHIIIKIMLLIEIIHSYFHTAIVRLWNSSYSSYMRHTQPLILQTSLRKHGWINVFSLVVPSLTHRGLE